MHANAVNYNPELDQIAISSRRFDEIWIVDHNTTTEEAAGPAGDLLYRYGNPEAYGRGAEEDRVLFGQHDVQWIPEGHPQAGQLMVYSNGNDRPECQCSTIDVWAPPLLSDGSYEIPEVEAMGLRPSPGHTLSRQTLNSTVPTSAAFSPCPMGTISSVKVPPDICLKSRLQANWSGTTSIPKGMLAFFPQGTTPQQNAVFRAYRYGEVYQGLADKELVPDAPLEGGSGAPCELHANADSTVTNVGTLDGRTSISAFPNPTTTRINLTSSSPGTWHVINNLGQTMGRFTSQGHRILDCGNWPKGSTSGFSNPISPQVRAKSFVGPSH